MADEAERRRLETERRRRDARRAGSRPTTRVAGAETEALTALAHGGAPPRRRPRRRWRRPRLTWPRVASARGDGRGRAQLRPLETERGEVRVAVARAEDEVNAARSDVDVAELRLAEQAEQVRDQVEDDPVELDPAAAERAEREIARLERRIAAMGPVNALAPEQHAALDERVGALRADRDDLVVASRRGGQPGAPPLGRGRTAFRGRLRRGQRPLRRAVRRALPGRAGRAAPGGPAQRAEEVPQTVDSPLRGGEDQLRGWRSWPSRPGSGSSP